MPNPSTECPHCHAPLLVPPGAVVVRCMYCGTETRIDAPAPPPYGAPPGAPPPYAAPPGAFPPYGAPPGAFPPYGAPPGAFPPFAGPPPGFPGAMTTVRTGRRKTGPVVGILMGVVGLVAVGGLVFFLIRTFSSKVEGSMSASGGSLGTWTVSPGDCNAGTGFVPQFMGAELSGGGARVRIIGSGAGNTQVAVFGPGQGEPVLFERDQCTRFDVSVSLTNTTVNDVRAVDGRLGVDCTAPDGSHFTADLKFETCH